MRETVSAHANRLDAWYTAVAPRRAWRASARPSPTASRSARTAAGGRQAAAAPQPPRATCSAPPRRTATTASILRSGWSAFGGDAESAGLAVDLSSDRIRRARWLATESATARTSGALLGARLRAPPARRGPAGQIEEVRRRRCAPPAATLRRRRSSTDCSSPAVAPTGGARRRTRRLQRAGGRRRPAARVAARRRRPLPPRARGWARRWTPASTTSTRWPMPPWRRPCSPSWRATSPKRRPR